MSSIRRIASINSTQYNCRYWECSCGAAICTVGDYGPYYFNPAITNYIFKLAPWGSYVQYYDEPTLIYAGPGEPIDWVIQSF